MYRHDFHLKIFHLDDMALELSVDLTIPISDVGNVLHRLDFTK